MNRKSWVSLRARLGPACIALALTACPSKESAPTPAPPSSTAAKKPTGPWTVDGQNVAIKAAFATGTEGQTSWRVSIADRELSCEQVVKDYPQPDEKSDGATRMDMWFVRQIDNKGKDGAWSFRSAALVDEAGYRSLRAQGSLMSDLKSEGQNIEIPDLELALYDSRKTKAVITYSGPLRVTACKRIKRSERPQPQPNFELTLEKRPLPILGATLRPESGQQRLRLTPSAHDCRSNVNRGVDWYLDVVVPEGKNKAKLISLQGDRFAEQPARSKGLDKVSINVKPGKALARISLSGSLDLAGYPLTMKGTVVARRCQVAPKKKP